MSATLHVIHSGSAANGYILTCGNNKLIIEAGCKYREYLRGLNYDIKNTYCIVSHGHSDHCRNLDRILSYGIPAYAPKSVCDIYPKCNTIESMKRYTVGAFKVVPLKVPHGDCECFAFYLELPDGQKGLFATDCEWLPYSIKGLNFILIECNNSQELIVDRLCDGYDARSSFSYHMELNETIKTINRLKGPALNTVALLHLSDGNSNEQMFKDRVFAETGVRPFIAESGLIVDLTEDF